jgi:hypothetical protein
MVVDGILDKSSILLTRRGSVVKKNETVLPESEGFSVNDVVSADTIRIYKKCFRLFIVRYICYSSCLN